MGGPLVALPLEVYNQVSETLNVRGNYNGGVYTRDFCYPIFEWEHIPILEPPQLLTKQNLRFWQATAMTMANSLKEDFEDIGAARNTPDQWYGHSDMHTLSLSAQWEDCDEGWAYSYQSGSIPAYCVNRCLYLPPNSWPSGDISGMDYYIAKRDEVILAKQIWYQTLHSELGWFDEADLAQAAEDVNDAASTCRYAAAAVDIDHYGYKNIMNYVPWYSGDLTATRFRSDYYAPNDRMHLSWNAYETRNIGSTIYWRDNEKTPFCWPKSFTLSWYNPATDLTHYQHNSFEWGTAPDGSFYPICEIPLFPVQYSFWYARNIEEDEEKPPVYQCWDCLPPYYLEGHPQCCSWNIEGRSAFVWTSVARGNDITGVSGPYCGD